MKDEINQNTEIKKMSISLGLSQVKIETLTRITFITKQYTDYGLHYNLIKPHKLFTTSFCLVE